MKIDLEGLGVDKLQFQLERDKGNIFVLVQDLVGGTGNIMRQDNLLSLQSVFAKSLSLGLGLPLGKVQLIEGNPAKVSEFHVDLSLPQGQNAKPFSGTAKLASLEGTQIKLKVSEMQFTFDILGKNVRYEQVAGGKGSVLCEEVSAYNAQMSIAGMLFRIDSLAVKNLRVSWGDGPFLVEIESAQLIKGSMQHSKIELAVDTASLSEGLRIEGSKILLGNLGIGCLTFLLQLSEKEAKKTLGEKKIPVNVPPSTPVEKTKRKAHPFNPDDLPVDLKLLDGLQGHINVDLGVSIKIPVISQRNAIHKFRIPIQEGIINYKELEDDLSTLENAFIDFEVREGKLVLERDIPLIPGTNKPIILWDLDQEELTLANKRLVRLRTLPYFIFAEKPKPEEDEEDASVALEKLHLDNIDVDLSLPNPLLNTLSTTGFDGLLSYLSFARLTVKGEVLHRTKQELVANTLLVSAKSLIAKLHKLPLGKRFLEIKKLEIASLENSKLSFAGIYPTQFQAYTTGVKVQNILFE